jgi:hypothetical protein
MADNKRQVAHARWTIEIFKKYSYMPYFEILEMIEEIAANRPGKSGASPVWRDLPGVTVSIYRFVETAKERMVAKGRTPSDRKAFKQVEEFFEARMVAARRRALPGADSPFKSYYQKSGHNPFSFDKIKRIYALGRDFAPDVRNEYPDNSLAFKRFLDEQDAKVTRLKSGAVTPRI